MTTTNLTIDDSSLDIIYSDNWVLQSSSDPSTEKFFQSTYHSAQGDGASANITFVGSAVYLYGTKGPGHANYSVQFDDFIIFYSADQSETDYQQLLFGQAFDAYGTHFVSLTSRHVSSTRNWLDLDYITITVNETDSNTTVPSSSAPTSTPTASPTISPPWLQESSFTGVSTAFSSPSTNASPSNPESSSSATNRLTLILAAVFGGIVVIALILGLGFLIARRGKRRRDDQTPLRPETQDNGTGAGAGAGAFVYKPPPSPPSFFAGQVSPTSTELQSPSPQRDPFYDRIGPGIGTDRHAQGHAQFHGGMLESRHSPHSMLSLGGATALTAVSTTQLLNPHSYKVEGDASAHKHADSAPVAGLNVGKTRSQARTPSDLLPIYKQHRVFDSESATNLLRGSQTAAGAGVGEPAIVVFPGSSEHALPDQTDNGTQRLEARPDEPPIHLMALHASHRSDSNISPSRNAAPKRPKRPTDGLFDFLGSQIAQKLERSATAKRRRDDANSERTNFLKV